MNYVQFCRYFWTSFAVLDTTSEEELERGEPERYWLSISTKYYDSINSILLDWLDSSIFAGTFGVLVFCWWLVLCWTAGLLCCAVKLCVWLWVCVSVTVRRVSDWVWTLILSFCYCELYHSHSVNFATTVGFCNNTLRLRLWAGCTPFSFLGFLTRVSFT